MANRTTALSAGLIMAKLLEKVDDVPVWPVYCKLPDELPDGPGIVYARRALRTDYTKPAAPRRKAVVEVVCYHPDYAPCVALAERVVEAVEGRTGRLGNLMLGSATLDDATEDFEADKYTQTLTFTLTINTNTNTNNHG